jgi:hypothetical protein
MREGAAEVRAWVGGREGNATVITGGDAALPVDEPQPLDTQQDTHTATRYGPRVINISAGPPLHRTVVLLPSPPRVALVPLPGSGQEHTEAWKGKSSDRGHTADSSGRSSGLERCTGAVHTTRHTRPSKEHQNHYRRGYLYNTPRS